MSEVLPAEPADGGREEPAGGHAIVFTTVASTANAEVIARHLVELRIAACVQLVPIGSVYRWRGEIVGESEVLLLVKTRRELYPQVERAVVSLHGYDVPELLMVEVSAGLPSYLGWIDEVTGGPGAAPADPPSR